MDSKGEGQLIVGEMLPIVATDHEEDHVADNALPEVDNALPEVDNALPEEDHVADNALPEVNNALPEDPDLVLALVDLDIGLAQEDLVVDNALPEVDNVLPEVGAHNLRNVRGRPRRRPFSKTLSPRSQALVNEAKAKVAALNKIQKEKEARLNKPNNIGLKKAQKPSFSKV